MKTSQSSLVLTSEYFKIILDKVHETFMNKHQLVKLPKALQLYGYGDYNDAKPNLKQDFEDIGSEVDFQPIVQTLHEGFIDQDQGMVVYTDHQIFERYQRFKLKSTYDKKQAISLKELTSLQVGDFVTHIDHGIGEFGGLQKIDVNGKKQEAIKLVYQGGDVLYISIHSLHKISRYNGKEGTAPSMNKLGSGAWQKTKAKAKKRVKEIAFDLIKLYAQRLVPRQM